MYSSYYSNMKHFHIGASQHKIMVKYLVIRFPWSVNSTLPACIPCWWTIKLPLGNNCFCLLGIINGGSLTSDWPNLCICKSSFSSNSDCTGSAAIYNVYSSAPPDCLWNRSVECSRYIWIASHLCASFDAASDLSGANMSFHKYPVHRRRRYLDWQSHLLSFW